jgi:hypothetical protein
MLRLSRAVLLIGGAIAFAVLVARIGAGVIVDMLRRVGWAVLAVSALYATHIAVRAFALWRSIPSGSGHAGPPPRDHQPPLRDHQFSYAEVLRVRLSAEAVEVLTLSGPFLAEPAKGWLLTRYGFSTADAYGGVALEYLLNTVISCWLGGAALAMLLARGVLSETMRAAAVMIIVALIAIVIACVVAAVTGVGLIVPVVRRVGMIAGRARAETAARRVDPVERAMVGFMHNRPARLAEVLTIEVAAHALLALEIWIVARALGFHIGLADPFIVEGGVKFIGVAFFFIPGQLGASEGVYTLLFGAIGLPAAAGLTMALVRRIRALIVAGAALAMVACTGDRRLRDS